MFVRYSDAVAEASLAALAAALDGGAGPGKLRFYTAPMPIDGAAITTQTLIAECALSATAVASVAARTALFDTILAGVIVGTGTITWARLVDGDGAVVADVDAGATGSGAAIELSQVTIGTTGGFLEIDNASLTY